ncbi:hypothetical protein KC866_03420 [Patescibacteria group bacterium]|nr:hypothetical protein [Patescibacteria group bacterium]
MFTLIINSSIVYAGSLTPTSNPAPTGYSLDNIYERLTTNDTSVEASHPLNPTSGPGATFHSLSEIYNLIPTIDPDTVLEGTTYLGIDGTIQTRTLSASSNTVLAGYYNATTLSSVDSDLTAANITSGTDLFGVTGTANIATGSATTGQVLSGATFSTTASSGLTGTMTNVGTQTLTPTTTNTAITAGYHDGSGYCAGDSDLVATNIASGTTLFGVAGTANLATGSATTGQVLSGASFSTSSDSGLTGTMTNVGSQTITPTTSNTTITAGYHDGTGYCGGDSDLVASKIKDGEDIFGVTGSYKPNVLTCSELGYSCTGSSGDICNCGNAGCVNVSTGSGITTYTDVCSAVGLSGLTLEAKENGEIQANLAINLSCLLGACDNNCQVRVCYLP